VGGVGDPLVRSLESLARAKLSDRYLKIEVNNNGKNGHEAFIELRQIKGYAPIILHEPKIPKIEPKGPPHNFLSHHLTGGSCKVVEYNVSNGATLYQPETIEAPPTFRWAINGCFMDDLLTKDNNLLSYHANITTASYWANPTTNGVGVIVVDLTQNPGVVRTFRKFSVFQVPTDGAATGIQISTHSQINNTIPTFQDAGWKVALPWAEVGPPIVEANPPGAEPSGNTMKCSSEYTVDGFTTRYLKIEVNNNGKYGPTTWIALRQIKGYTH